MAELSNSKNDVVINGTEENDFIYSSGARTTIYAGDGDDTVNAHFNGGRYEVVYGGAGNDSINNTATNSTVNGGAGDDTILSSAVTGGVIEYAEGDGNDLIIDFDINDTIHITKGSITSHYADGDDYIINVGNGSMTIKGIGSEPLQVQTADGSATVLNYNVSNHTDGIYTKVYGTSSADSIFNAGTAARVFAKEGNDYIINYSNNSAHINAGDGNDTIRNILANYASIKGGAGNDSIVMESNENTIRGGADNDVISLNGSWDMIEYAAGDGNDTVFGFKSSDTLHITDTKNYSTVKSGDDLIVNVDDGSILLKNAAKLDSVKITNNVGVNIATSADNTLIFGTYYRDSIGITGHNVQISEVNGDDIISLGGYDATVGSGYGNDTVYGAASNDLIYLSNNLAADSINGISIDGNNLIISMDYGKIILPDSVDRQIKLRYYDDPIKILNADKPVLIRTALDNNSIVGTSGNDTVINKGDASTLNTGAGNDLITLLSGSNVVEYAAGDGNDTIYGYKSTDTIRITDGSEYETVQSGNDLILSVGDGSVRLVDAATLSANITGGKYIESSIGANISNTASNTVINGTPYQDTIRNEGNNVTINGSDDNDSIYSTNGKGVLINAGAGDDSITLVSNGSTVNGGDGNDSINVTAILNVVNGGAGNDYVLLGGENIFRYADGDGNDTIANYHTSDTISITDGSDYSTLLNGDDVLVSLANGSILLQNAASKSLQLNGGKYIESSIGANISNTASNTVINGTPYQDTIRNEGNNVTINGSDDNDSIYSTNGKNVLINAGAGDDSITLVSNGSTVNGGDGNDSINVTAILNVVNGGAGNDYVLLGGENIFRYADGDDNDTIANYHASDTISIIDGSDYSTLLNGDDVLVSLANGSILLQNAASKSLQLTGGKYIESSIGANISNTASNTVINGTPYQDTIRNEGNNVTINGSDDNDSIYSTNGKGVLINAGAGNDSITLISNGSTVNGGDGDDSINVTAILNVVNGGAGNDYVRLGGENIFRYADGDGNDTIANYHASDTISIIDGSDYSTLLNGDDVLVSLANGSILLADAVDKSININGGNYVSVPSEDDTTPSDGSDDDTSFDTITNADNGKFIEGDQFNNYIINTGDNVTIQANGGNDIIEGSETYGELIQFGASDGNDTVVNFGDNDTLHITNGSIDSSVVSGNDIIFNVKGLRGTGTITLKDAADMNFKLDGATVTADVEHEIINSKSNVKVNGTNGNDFISNSGSNVTINGAGGNDTIELSDNGEMIQFGANEGNDYVNNFGANDTLYISNGEISSVKLAGNDYIVSVKGANSTGVITLGGAGAYPYKIEDNYLIIDNVSTIVNNSDNVKVAGTSKADYIVNSGSNVTIQAGGGADTIEGSNNGEMFMFSYASGDDVITNFGKNDTLKATSGTISAVDTVGDDVVVSIKKKGKSTVGRITLVGAADYNLKQNGTDLTVDDVNYINNDKDKIKVSGTTGKDYITNTGEKVTIQAGGDDDTIEGSDLYGEQFWFSYASGDDVITNFDKNDTLKSTSGTISAVETVGNDVVVSIAKKGQSAVGKITLQGAANLNFIKTSTALTVDPVNYINNDQDDRRVNGTNGRDYITNTGEKVTIQPGKGDDTIDGSAFGEQFWFSYASGDNVITNFGVNDTLKNTSGTMSYAVDGDDVVVSIKKNSTVATVTLKGAADYDFIQRGNNLLVDWVPSPPANDRDNVKLSGTTGRDYIINSAENVTIQAGAGNDTITGSDTFGERFLFSYASGDDIITNFGDNDTLQSTSGTISAVETVGNDVAVTISKTNQKAVGTVTLKDAAGKKFVRKGAYLTVEIVTELTNTKDDAVIEGTDGDDIIENTGDNVTIKPNAGNDTITGSDTFGELYQLSSLDGGNVITNFGANDSIQVVKGSIYSTVLSADGNDLIVKLGKASTAGTVTLQGVGGYTELIKKSGKYLIFDDVNLLTNTANNKKINGTARRDYIINTGDNVTINGAGGNDTIELSDNREVISFGATGDEDLVIGFGQNDTLYINSGSITSQTRVGNDYIVNVSNGKTIGTVTLEGAGNYLFEQSGKKLTVKSVNYINNDKDNIKVSGTGKDDYITNAGSNVSIQAGGGNDTIDGSNAGEMFMMSYASGDDVILNFDKNDTLRATSGTISSIEKVGDDHVVTITKKNQKAVGTITLKDTADYRFKQTSAGLTVDVVNEIENDEDNIKISGTIERDLISNTGENVTIQAGGDDDTIIGSDLYGDTYLFSYASGDDVITNFGKNDTLKATSGSISSVDIVGDDAVVTIKKSKKIAVGKITLQGAADYDFIQSGNTLSVKQIVPIKNDEDKIKVNGTTGDDYIINNGERVTIQAGGGNDTIDGSIFGEMMLFSYASGDDVITNFGVNDTLKSTSGTIKLTKSGDDALVTITKNKKSGTVLLEGAGNLDLVKSGSIVYVKNQPNMILNTEDKKKINGTGGNDYIANTAQNVTIQAGGGDDTIEGSDSFGERFQFSYASGDDVITNFSLGDTLQATSGTLSYKKDGNDYIVSIKKSGKSTVGTITLKDAAENYTLAKSGSNYIARAKSTSAQLPSDDQYWFLDSQETNESPLSEIVSTESAVDLPTDFNDVFKQSTVELATNIRHRQKQFAK